MKFSEAADYLYEGAKIKRKNDTAWYTKDTVLELPLKTIIKDFFEYNDWEVKS